MKEKIPDYIPMYCNSDCKHHSGLFISKCDFYGEDVTRGWECIAVERYSKSPNVEPPIIDKENKTGNEQPLSQKYYVLKPYKGLAYLMMIVSTMYTIYSINHLIEASEAMKEYVGGASMDNAIIALVITYIITMFTLYCLTKIIDFLFDLDRKN